VAGVPGRHAGGIAGLVAFLRQYGAAVEADLQHHYGLALTDLPAGRLTWRRLKVLIDGLPRDSEMSRRVNGEAADWSTADHLLAITVDALQIANWQRSKDGATGRNRPSPIPRPGLRTGDRVGKTSRTPEEVRAYLAQFRPVTEGD
jgi:hypothetical protein